jgi:hypothetical protein
MGAWAGLRSQAWGLGSSKNLPIVPCAYIQLYHSMRYVRADVGLPWVANAVLDGRPGLPVRCWNVPSGCGGWAPEDSSMVEGRSLPMGRANLRRWSAILSPSNPIA